MTLESAGQAAAEQIGIDWRNVPHDGRWHEVPAAGKDTRNGSGRIRIFTDEEGGTVWNWTTGDSLTFWARGEVDLDMVARESRRKKNEEQRAADDAERRKLAADAATKSAALWKAGQSPGGNPYLDRKGVAPVDSLRQLDAAAVAKIIGYAPKRKGEALEGRLLIVPVKIGDKLTSCQLIDESGRKANLYGGELKAGYWSTAKLPDGTGDGITLLIAEGVATALSSSQATGHITVAAMSCGNMRAVAVYLRQRYPDARLIVCSDKGNGEADARRAAIEAGALLAVPEINGDGTDFNDLHTTSGFEIVKMQIETATAPLPTPSPERETPSESNLGKPLFISVPDMLTHTVKVRKLIGRIIERGCTGQIFGPSGDGKTFVAVDLFLSVAAGIAWNGIQCEQGLSLYFNGEGHSGFKRRINAWHKHNGTPDLSNALTSQNIITFDTAGLLQVAAEVKAIEERTGKQVALIVIDTLARHLQGDENSTKDMSEFVRAVDGLRCAFPESTAIVVHHTGNDADKAGRSRGSSALKAACDFEIQCMKGVLTFTKMKDSEAPSPIEFKYQQVEIGTDEETGEPITSCIVQYGERSFKNRQESIKLTRQEQTIHAIVCASPGILIGDLRSSYYDHRRKYEPDAKINTLKNAFLRSYESLSLKGLISEDGSAVFPQEADRHKNHKTSQSDECDAVLNVTNRHITLKGCDVCDDHKHDDAIPNFDF